MSVPGVAAGAVPSFQSTAGRFSLLGTTEFARTLNLGQIIQGKVLRQYEGNRYLVSFSGHDRVVDSAIPLTANEVIHGRVIGIGDRVELQRVYPDADGKDTESPVAVDSNRGFLGARDQWLEKLLSRYQVDLNADGKTKLNQIAQSVNDPLSLGMVGIAVSKLGLPQTPELLLSVYSLLKRANPSMDEGLRANATSANAALAQGLGAPLATVRQLADALTKSIGQSEPEQEQNKPSANGDSVLPNLVLAIDPKLVKQVGDDGARERARQSAWRVVNAQAGGAVAHRVGSLPLLLGGQLVEVSVALFEQRRDAEQQPEAKHRQIVFALRTEHLGAVQIAAQLSGERVRIRVTGEDAAKTQQIAAHSGELRTALVQAGWRVDEIVYEGSDSGGRDPAVASVIEHIAMQDSLNRLL